MYKKIPGAAFLLVMLLFFTIPACAVRVQPLVINLDMTPGDAENFELRLTGTGERETVSLNLMHPVQNIDGRLRYQEVNPELNPAVDWIELERTEVTIPANEVVVVGGSVNLPFDAGGSHTAVIMVDQVDPVDRPDSLIGFRIRYAIRININIDRPGQRPTVEILDFSLNPDNEGRPKISVHFKNTSPLRFPAVADVTVRGEDRRLIERVPVFSGATSLDRRDNFSVYPGTELIYEGEITETMFPGSYEIQMFFHYADGRQIIRRKTVDVEEEFLREEAVKYINVEPEDLSLSMIPGASSTQILTLTNNFTEPLIVNTMTGEIYPEYRQSIFAGKEFDLRGNRQFILQPGAVNRQLLIFRSPRDQLPGGYYGYYDIEVYNLDQQMLETYRLNVTSLVEGEANILGEILDLTHSRGEDRDTFSATIKNTGDIHIVPRVRLELYDEGGEIYANLNLSLQDEERILPEFTRFVTAERRLITEGEYRALLILEADNRELDRSEFSLTIGGSNKIEFDQEGNSDEKD